MENQMIDYLASDKLDSPIDADKLDYIKRDSYYCGVSYGDGIDINRILNSLTVKENDNKIKLAYYAKGLTAISSMLLARYQLYGAVYWNHKYRCLHAMIFYATQIMLNKVNNGIPINNKITIREEELRKLYYYRVICKCPWPACWEKILGDKSKYVKSVFNNEANMFIRARNYTFDFIYMFTDENGRILLKNILERNLYKRIYSKKLLGKDISSLKDKCKDRVQITKDIQRKLIEAVKREQMTAQRTDTSAELIIKKELKTAEPKYFSIITRYLHPKAIETCIKNVITVL